MRGFLTITYIWARRCVVALIGGTVVIIGVLMIVLPGPAFIVIPSGLAILGLEFACARRWLRALRASGTKVFGKTLSWLRPAATRNNQESLERRPRLAPKPLAVRANAKTTTDYLRTRPR